MNFYFRVFVCSAPIIDVFLNSKSSQSVSPSTGSTHHWPIQSLRFVAAVLVKVKIVEFWSEAMKPAKYFFDIKLNDGARLDSLH